VGAAFDLQDRLLYALDGLASRSPSAAASAAADVADILASARGRLALRAGGLFGDVASRGAVLASTSDPSACLALAAAYLLLAADPGAGAALATAPAAALAVALLKASADADPDKGAGGPSAPPLASPDAARRALRLLRAPALARFVPASASSTPAAVAMVAVAGATDPHADGGGGEALRVALGEAGAVGALATAAAEAEAAPTSDSSLWTVNAALTCLEHLTFACPPNEAALLTATVSGGIALPAWLVGAATRLAARLPSSSAAHTAALSVAMNATQGGGPGRGPVLEAGGVWAALAAVAAALPAGPPSRAADAAAAAAHARTLAVALGLFINLADGDGGGEAAAGAAAAVLPALARLVAAAPDASAPDAADVTADTLARDEAGGVASMVQAYAAVALGFVVEAGGADARADADAALAPAGGLAAAAAAVRGCAAFYTNTGAVTQRAAASLARVLACLEGGG